MLLNDIIINNYDFRRSKNLIWETWKTNELYIRFTLINDVIYKLCTKCKKYKPMTSKFFPRRNNVKCGYGSHCKECEKEKESKRIRIPSFNENGELYCHVCKTYKDVSEFYKGEKYICRQGYSRECKDCEKERKKIKRATQEINDRDRFLSRLLSGCKTRALKNNIPFDLTKEQLIETKWKVRII